MLRLSPALHEALRRAAAEAGLSLNSYCARKLASSTAPLDDPVAKLISRAIEQFGSALIGVLAFGSWARGDATLESDVDVLVVVAADVPIVRSLYRSWDETPLEWDGRDIQVHIVHAPDEGEVPSGLWAEAAIDGVVVFEQSLALSRRLADIRRQIVEGTISSRETHGQRYWVAEGLR